MLNSKQLERYNRNISIPEIGIEGQEKLSSGKVLVVGAGGLGSPVCLYLAAAGVGTLGIVDKDKVELSNLQRQILHSIQDIGNPKTESAKKKLMALNPEINVIPYQKNFDENPEIINKFDLAIDCTDNFQTRYLLNRICVEKRKPLIHAGVSCLSGQVFTIIPGEGPCFECIFADPPTDSLINRGILGVVAGIIGALEANEAVKLLTGIGELLVATMLIFDGYSSSFRKVKIPRNPNCPVCGNMI